MRSVRKTEIAKILAGTLVFSVVGPAGLAHSADDLTAAAMMKQMNDKEQYHYIAGIVAGLGTARYVNDGNDRGAACIDKWFYDTPDIRKTIYAAFDRFGDKSPSANLYAMAARECGK